jgi:hypothetical protein
MNELALTLVRGAARHDEMGAKDSVRMLRAIVECATDVAPDDETSNDIWALRRALDAIDTY